MSYRSPSTGRVLRAVVFDTFGSVVDWRTGVARQCAAFFTKHGLNLDAARFADAWRACYEPSMTPIRNGTRGYTPLEVLHRENLENTFEQFGIAHTALPAADLDDLNRAWERLDPWPDSIPGIAALGTEYLVGPLSNANTALLGAMARHAGLPWTVVMGSDVTRAYKPSADAYLEMTAALRLEPGEVMMAAAHNYDLAAARKAGLATGFIARPTELGPGQTKDLEPESDWDVSTDSILALAARLNTPVHTKGSLQSSTGTA